MAPQGRLGCDIFSGFAGRCLFPCLRVKTLETCTMNPHAHMRSLPPEGAVASFEAARQEAA